MKKIIKSLTVLVVSAILSGALAIANFQFFYVFVVIAGIYVLGDIAKFLAYRKYNKFVSILEKSTKYVMNERFVKQEYKTFKHSLKMDAYLLKATKKDAKKAAADNRFKLITKINQTIKNGNSVSLGTKFRSTSLYEKFEAGKILKERKIEYGLKALKVK